MYLDVIVLNNFKEVCWIPLIELFFYGYLQKQGHFSLKSMLFSASFKLSFTITNFYSPESTSNDAFCHPQRSTGRGVRSHMNKFQ